MKIRMISPSPRPPQMIFIASHQSIDKSYYKPIENRNHVCIMPTYEKSPR
jgi:hypothetical protein